MGCNKDFSFHFVLLCGIKSHLSRGFFFLFVLALKVCIFNYIYKLNHFVQHPFPWDPTAKSYNWTAMNLPQKHNPTLTPECFWISTEENVQDSADSHSTCPEMLTKELNNLILNPATKFLFMDQKIHNSLTEFTRLSSRYSKVGKE